MKQPFEIGATIFHKQWGEVVVVTAYTDKGFAYKGSPRTDIWAGTPVYFPGEGECYEAGFDSWELYTGNNQIHRPKFTKGPLLADVSKEWFAARIAAEGDCEVGAGSPRAFLPKDDDGFCGHSGCACGESLLSIYIKKALDSFKKIPIKWDYFICGVMTGMLLMLFVLWLARR